MTVTPYSQNEWPGPPRELAPLIARREERMFAYWRAFKTDASLADLWAAWVDLGQRVAKKLAGIK